MSLLQMLAATGGGSTAITLVGSEKNSTNTSSLVINKPTGTADGDLMVAMVCVNNSVTWTPPAGWTTLYLSSSVGENSMSLFYKVAASEGASYAFGLSSSNTCAGFVVTYRNAQIGFLGPVTAASVSTKVASEVSIAADGSVLLGVASRSGASVTWTTPSGMTPVINDADATTASFALFSEDVDTGLTGTRSFTASGTGNHAVVLLGVFPSSLTTLAPEFIAVESTQTTVNGTTLVINKPTGTADGDLMVAVMSSDGNLTWTGDTGWTEVLDQGSGTPSLRVAYKVAASEGANYTFTTNNSKKMSGSILTYRNAVYDAIGTITTSDNPLVVTEVTAAVDYSRIIGVAARSVASLTITAPASMTTRVTDSDSVASSYVIADEVVGAVASGTRTFSGLGGSTNTAGVLISIKPA